MFGSIIFIFVVATSLTFGGNDNKRPTVKGGYKVGVEELILSDTSRKWPRLADFNPKNFDFDYAGSQYDSDGNYLGDSNDYPIKIEVFYPSSPTENQSHNNRYDYKTSPFIEGFIPFNEPYPFSPVVSEVGNLSKQAIVDAAPSGDGAFPVIVFAPGAQGAGPVDHQVTVERLASHGFIVVFVNHTVDTLGSATADFFLAPERFNFPPAMKITDFPCTLSPQQTITTGIGPNGNEFLRCSGDWLPDDMEIEPFFGFSVDDIEGFFRQLDLYRDVIFALDVLEVKNQTPGDPLEGLVDIDRVGIAGFSQGTGVGILVSEGLSAFNIAADPRIDAVLLIDGGGVDFFTSDVVNTEKPYLLLSGSDYPNGVAGLPPGDLDLGTEGADELFNAMSQNKRYKVIVPNTDHLAWIPFCAGQKGFADAAGVEDPYNFGPDTFSNPAALRSAINYNIPFLTPISVGSKYICSDLANEPNFDYVESGLNHPDDVMDLKATFAVAFFRTVLNGETAYEEWLQPNSNKLNNLPLEVEIEVGNPQ